MDPQFNIISCTYTHMYIYVCMCTYSLMYETVYKYNYTQFCSQKSLNL